MAWRGVTNGDSAARALALRAVACFVNIDGCASAPPPKAAAGIGGSVLIASMSKGVKGVNNQLKESCRNVAYIQ
jgi:hypothetical protein